MCEQSLRNIYYLRHINQLVNSMDALDQSCSQTVKQQESS